MKKIILYAIIAGHLLLLLLFIRPHGARETLQYFPNDPEAAFLMYRTTLAAEQKGSHHEINWESASRLDRKAYLRQDVSLLYRNGRLAGIQKAWKRDQDVLRQKESLPFTDSAHYEAVTIHHAELHGKEDAITAAQAISSASLYVIHSAGVPFQAFEKPLAGDQEKWKNTLSAKRRSLTEHAIQEGLGSLKLNPAHYTALPLTELPARQKTFLARFSPARQEAIIGRLWEGLYKQYVFGIKKEDGTVTDPVNSTVPLLLLRKDRKELLVLIVSGDGVPFLLKQQLQ